MKTAHERRSKNKKGSIDSIVLSPSQLRTLQSLEETGWHLCFVRRSLYLDSLPVIVDDFTGRTAIIDKAGLIDINHHLKFRDSVQRKLQ